jgi:hypothetical protein
MLGIDRLPEYQFLDNIGFQIIEVRENPGGLGHLAYLRFKQGRLDELQLPALPTLRQDGESKGANATHEP